MFIIQIKLTEDREVQMFFFAGAVNAQAMDMAYCP